MWESKDVYKEQENENRSQTHGIQRDLKELMHEMCKNLFEVAYMYCVGRLISKIVGENK